jgi:RNA-directed DNA polymerase
MKFTHVYPSDIFQALERIIVSAVSLEATLRELFEPYQRFTIPKSSGGPGRVIEAPADSLKSIQSALLHQLLYKVPITPDCHGFVPGRSIVTHASMHKNQNELLNYDIENAFPSVSRHRVVETLTRRLGSYIKHHTPRLDRRRRESLIQLIADLVTHEDHLPQGAPTSGAMLNLVLAPLDRRMRKEVKRWSKKGCKGLVYSRYADDLNLSGSEELPGDADHVMRRAIHQAGFRFNASKVHRADRGLGQTLKICGVHVDGEQLRLPRKKLKTYRAILHKAFYQEKLTPELRGQIHGIAGLTLMVYGRFPKILEGPWRLLTARHGFSERDMVPDQQISGYSH